jgi:hypothetical protein
MALQGFSALFIELLPQSAEVFQVGFLLLQNIFPIIPIHQRNVCREINRLATQKAVPAIFQALAFRAFSIFEVAIKRSFYRNRLNAGNHSRQVRSILAFTLPLVEYSNESGCLYVFYKSLRIQCSFSCLPCLQTQPTDGETQYALSVISKIGVTLVYLKDFFLSSFY